MPVDQRPIAMLDSGVGGLSILREVRRQLPNEDILYFADQGHVPYGPRPVQEIRALTEDITRFFLELDAKTVVLACNAASAASLHHLRRTFPHIPFVGMEPAVKPAAERTHSGVIGVLTTKATFQGELFASVIDRFAANVRVETQVCPIFVELVEQGELDSPRTRETARHYLAPLLEAKADQLVLGCTHFPFLTPILREIVGAGVDIIDPSPAVARQIGRVITGMRNDETHRGVVRYFTSGDRSAFVALAGRLMEEPVRDTQVTAVRWVEGSIKLAGT